MSSGAEGIISCGIVLPVSIVVHCCIKHLLKNSSAFAVKSNINMSFSKTEGIIGILALFSILLIKDQLVLIPVSGLDSSAPIS